MSESEPNRDLELAGLENRLGYAFGDRVLLEEALTHRSLAANQRATDHNERLEFLGDSVLGLVTAEWAFERFANAPEGELATMKSQLVKAKTLADAARYLEIGPLIAMTVGEEKSGGRTKRSLLANSLEAILGAVMLDGGFEATRRVIRPLLDRAIARDPTVVEQDPKTVLQERLQAAGRALPEYHEVRSEGPDHALTFYVECQIDGQVVATASGTSKRRAERAAARAALATLEMSRNED